MILPKQTQYRILRTMTKSMRAIFLRTASELNELSKELIDATEQSLRIMSIYVSKKQAEKIISEMADVLIMLVALKNALEIQDKEIMDNIYKVCERYEQA